MKYQKRFLLLSILAAYGAVSPSAQAQVGSKVAAAPTQGLQEIVITAERRSQNLQTAPIAVTAVTGDELSERGVSTAQDITKLVPAVTFAEGGGGSNQVFVRGIGGLASNGLTEQLVAFNMDGTYLSRTGSINGLFFDLDRIEIVKGPQGTLYGRNATAGAVNVISNKPTLDRFGGNVALTLGDYGLKKVDAAVNVPLSDTFGVRVAVQNVDRRGYLSDGYNDEKHWSARASFLAKLSDNLTVTLTTDYSHLGGKGGANVVAPLLNSSKPWAGPTSSDLAKAWTTPKFQIPGLPFLVPAQFQPETHGLPVGKVDNNNYSYYGSIDWDSGVGKFTLIPSYRNAKVDTTHYAAGFPVIDNEDYTTKSLEGRYASPDQYALRGVVGLYYLKEDGSFLLLSNPANALGGPPTFMAPAAPPLSAYTPSKVDGSHTTAQAVFGQATYDLTDTLRLIAGARFSDEKKTVAGSVGFPFSGNIDDKKTTWKAGLEIDLSPKSMAYATVGTGFKAGGFFPAVVGTSGGQAFGNTFKPETITSWTLGSKNRFLDNRLQLNAEAFYWDYKDKQISHLSTVLANPTTGATTLNLVTENAGKAKFYGLEVESRYLATDNDMIAATVQYEHSNYDSFVYSQPGGALTNCKTTAVGPSTTVDCSGQVSALTPSWSLTVAYNHTLPLASGADLVFGIAGRYKSSYWLSDEHLPGELQGSAGKVDLSVAYNAPGGNWSVTGFVNNVTNKAVLNAAFVNTFIQAAMAGIEAPRTYGVRASLRF